ncbi:DUF5753 domain-containing protein [Streptomyces netropsis]
MFVLEELSSLLHRCVGGVEAGFELRGGKTRLVAAVLRCSVDCGRRYVSLEAAASHIKDFQPILVPGLLQTEDYVQALMDGGRPDDTPEQIFMRVRLRMERQSILSGEAPPLLWAVVGEAALRNQVGGPATMRHQIKALLEVSDKPNVTLQILSFTAGAHPGVDGAFTVLSMPEQDEQEVILVEAMTSSLYLETEQQVSRYKFAFNHIRAAAASPSQSRDLLRRALYDYRDLGD